MILLDGTHLTLSQLLAIADQHEPVGLAPEARARVAASRAVVDAKAAGDAAVYGINTGFGIFAETRIDKHDLAALQLNLLRSHAAGVGDPLPIPVVRALLTLRANVLAKGFSGIRLSTLDALIALAQEKAPRGLARMADSPVVQAEIAKREMLLEMHAACIPSHLAAKVANGVGERLAGLIGPKWGA